MKQKIFLAIILVCLIVSFSFVAVYEVASSSGYDKGYSLGFMRGQASNLGSNSRAYDNGYQDGLRAAQNSTHGGP